MKAILVPPSMPAISVDVTMDDLRHSLGWVSFAYPYDDPVCLAHDDDGIANSRLPNRTISGTIMPGPFYVLGITPDGDVTSLTHELEEKYLRLFHEVERFPPGKWKVTTNVTEDVNTAIISLTSEWEVAL